MSSDVFDNNGLTQTRTKRAIVITWGNALVWYTNGYTQKGKGSLEKQQRFGKKFASEKCSTSLNFIFVNGPNYLFTPAKFTLPNSLIFKKSFKL